MSVREDIFADSLGREQCRAGESVCNGVSQLLTQAHMCNHVCVCAQGMTQ